MQKEKYVDQSLGALLVRLCCPFVKDAVKIKRGSRILLFKNQALGDSIYTLPLLRELHKKTGKKIDVMCSPSNEVVYKRHKFIGDIHYMTIGNVLRLKNNYDLVIDAEPWANMSALFSWWMGKSNVGFTHGLRSRMYTHQVVYYKGQHIIDTYMDFYRMFFSGETVSTVKIPSTKKVMTNVRKLLPEEKIVGIAIGVSANAKTRMWITNRWVKVIREIKKTYPDYTVVLFGAQHDNDEANQIAHLTGAVNMHHTIRGDEFFAALGICDLFIGCDSGPAHIAATQGVPTIGLYGPNTPVIWAPYGKKNVAIWHKNPGVPSIDNLNPWFAPPTPADEQAMKEITVDEVFAAVKKILS